MKTRLTLPPARRITALLGAIVFSLLVLSTAGQVSKYYLGHPRLKGLVPAFYVDYESNVPTWYSSAALGLAAVLLALIAAAAVRQRSRFWPHWAVLAFVFGLLSVDEVAMFHEYPIEPLRNALNAGGLLYYTWVVPGLLFVAILALAYRRFLLHLPRRTRLLTIAAGVVYVGGAIGVEMLSGQQADAFGEETFAYAMIITVEEAMEMLGIVIFIHALVEYINVTIGGLRISLGLGESPSA